MAPRLRENPYIRGMAKLQNDVGSVKSRLHAWGFDARPRGAVFLSIRVLGPNHRERLLKHLMLLDSEDRFLRFGYVPSDQQIAHYVEKLDFSSDAVFGVFNGRLEIVAMAHLAFHDAQTSPRVAEFGVSVATSLRGRGIGGRLYERAALHARNEGIEVLLIQALASNAAMLAITRRHGATVLRCGAESEAILKLPQLSLTSRLQERVVELWADLHHRLKVHARLVKQFTSLVRRFKGVG